MGGSVRQEAESKEALVCSNAVELELELLEEEEESEPSQKRELA